MRKKSKFLILIYLILFFSSLAFSQETKVLTPTGEEIQKLAKLKERILRTRAEFSTIDIQLYALQRDKILKQQELQKVISDLSMESANIKEAHKKDWGSVDDVSYNPEDQSSEAGVFILNKKEIKRDEATKESIKKDGRDEAKKEKEEIKEKKSKK